MFGQWALMAQYCIPLTEVEAGMLSLKAPVNRWQVWIFPLRDAAGLWEDAELYIALKTQGKRGKNRRAEWLQA